MTYSKNRIISFTLISRDGKQSLGARLSALSHVNDRRLMMTAEKSVSALSA